jgi:ribonuclease HI
LPSTIPPNPEPPAHDYFEVLDDSLTTFHHILDICVPNAPTRFIDGSSTKASTTSAARAGYTIVEGYPNNNTYTTIEINSLPPTTSSQQAGLYALTQALQRAKDKAVNIYTDSKYTISSILIAKYRKNRAS